MVGARSKEEPRQLVEGLGALRIGAKDLKLGPGQQHGDQQLLGQAAVHAFDILADAPHEGPCTLLAGSCGESALPECVPPNGRVIEAAGRALRLLSCGGSALRLAVGRRTSDGDEGKRRGEEK